MAQEQGPALAADFPAVTHEQWQALVAGVLAKAGVTFDPAAPERALARRTYDDIEVAALYCAPEPGVPEAGLPGLPPFVRGAEPAGASLGWDVRARHQDPDPLATNRAVLADLAGGASSLWLATPADLAVALNEVHLDLVAVVLDLGAQTVPAARAYLELVADQQPAEVRGSLGADPIATAARTGARPELEALLVVAELAAPYPQLLPVTVDGTCYSDAGGSDSDELALSLSAAVAYLRCLTGAGHPLADAYRRLEFRYAVTANQFGSIAKLRAARRLWDRVGQLCELEERGGQRQHAVTASAMLTRRDPWVNLMRTTVACFAAAVGGAQAITVAPFDSALGLPEEFGRRIARNTQAILAEESNLARVADAAGGSHYVESLTEQLAGQAWRKFTELERGGGAVAALESGLTRQLLERSWQARRENLARRRDPITGVSEYPLLAEEPLRRQPVPEPAPAGGLAQAAGTGLPRHRFAEEFERLRDDSDSHLAATGSRPLVFLAALGPAGAHSGRLSFASNLFAAGGVQPVVGTGSVAELVRDFTASGARWACLCGSEAGYREQAGEAAGALRQAGSTAVWIAGSSRWIGGPIEQAVYTGCDAVARLRAAHQLAGVAR